jgi:hypothetical protein
MTLIMFIILFLAILFVAYPLFLRSIKKGSARQELSSKDTELDRRKESSYAAIQEMQMDHQMGKLSDADYRSLYLRYKSEALEAIRALEQKGFDSDLEMAIEEEIFRKRSELTGGIRTAGGVSLLYCPGCGTPNDLDSSSCCACGEDLQVQCRECDTVNPVEYRFCKTCGQALALPCPQCGLSCRPGSRFCPRCGAGLVSSKEKK